jgi:hypothetical protein
MAQTTLEHGCSVDVAILSWQSDYRDGGLGLGFGQKWLRPVLQHFKPL